MIEVDAALLLWSFRPLLGGKEVPKPKLTLSNPNNALHGCLVCCLAMLLNYSSHIQTSPQPFHLLSFFSDFLAPLNIMPWVDLLNYQ